MKPKESEENRLGAYLKARRSKMDPAAFGFPATRRRTPGLRREEVAHRAHLSVTWYTWLEQGRGGAPSADVLDRIARALMLTETEREHLFLLALGRMPEVRYKAIEGVSPRLQRILDALQFCPAFIKTPTWDIVAWNAAAAAVLTDYGKLPPEKRNILRLIFGHSPVRSKQSDWNSLARFVVAAFRADVVRAGAEENVKALVSELCQSSPEFAAVWKENDVRAHGDGSKILHHPKAGKVALEFSAFAVDGRPDLGLVVYTPVTSKDTKRVKSLLGHTARPKRL